MLSSSWKPLAVLCFSVLVGACGTDETAPFGNDGSGGDAATATARSSATGGGVGGAGTGGAATSSGSGGQPGAGGFDPAQDPAAKINHPGDAQTRPVGVPITFSGQAI